MDCAVLVAVGVRKDGKRSVLSVSVSLKEVEVRWRAFFEDLPDRGLYDVLTAVGAMAFMLLQSLEAEFRIANYAVGFAIGTAAVVFLFAVPLWGIHRNLVRAKDSRIAALFARLELVDRNDIEWLETVTSHIDRIRSLPSWPVDIQLITRLFGHIILAPLA